MFISQLKSCIILLESDTFIHFLKHKIISEEQKEKNIQNEFIMHEIYAKISSHVRQLTRRAGKN